MKKHPLVDTTEPNYLEDTFDYDLPPLINFTDDAGDRVYRRRAGRVRLQLGQEA